MNKSSIGTETVRTGSDHLVQKLYSFLDIPGRSRVVLVSPWLSVCLPDCRAVQAGRGGVKVQKAPFIGNLAPSHSRINSPLTELVKLWR